MGIMCCGIAIQSAKCIDGIYSSSNSWKGTRYGRAWVLPDIKVMLCFWPLVMHATAWQCIGTVYPVSLHENQLHIICKIYREVQPLIYGFGEAIDFQLVQSSNEAMEITCMHKWPNTVTRVFCHVDYFMLLFLKIDYVQSEKS